MLLYSLTVLWFAQQGHTRYKPLYRRWYRHKVRPSFADMLATLRFACLRAAISATPTDKQGRPPPYSCCPTRCGRSLRDQRKKVRNSN